MEKSKELAPCSETTMDKQLCSMVQDDEEQAQIVAPRDGAAATSDGSETIPFHKHCQKTVCSAYGYQGQGKTWNVLYDQRNNLVNLGSDWISFFNGHGEDNENITYDLLAILKLINRLATTVGKKWTLTFKAGNAGNNSDNICSKLIDPWENTNLEYKFPKRFSVGIGADFRGVNFTSREWGSAGYFENISEGQLLSVPVYGDLKVHFWENKPFSPFVEYRLGYAFALNSLTATHYDSYMYGLIYYETRHQGWYSYLGIGVTYNHSSLSLGILGQNGHHKETMWGNTNDLSGGYMGGHPFELRYSYKIGSSAKR